MRLRAEHVASTCHYTPVIVQGIPTWWLLDTSFSLSLVISPQALKAFPPWTWFICGRPPWPEWSLTPCWGLAWVPECCLLLRRLKLMTKYNKLWKLKYGNIWPGFRVLWVTEPGNSLYKLTIHYPVGESNWKGWQMVRFTNNEKYI